MLRAPEVFLSRWLEMDLAVLLARHNIMIPPDQLIIANPLRDVPPAAPVEISDFRGTPVFSAWFVFPAQALFNADPVCSSKHQLEDSVQS